MSQKQAETGRLQKLQVSTATPLPKALAEHVCSHWREDNVAFRESRCTNADRSGTWQKPWPRLPQLCKFCQSKHPRVIPHHVQSHDLSTCLIQNSARKTKLNSAHMKASLSCYSEGLPPAEKESPLTNGLSPPFNTFQTESQPQNTSVSQLFQKARAPLVPHKLERRFLRK